MGYNSVGFLSWGQNLVGYNSAFFNYKLLVLPWWWDIHMSSNCEIHSSLIFDIFKQHFFFKLLWLGILILQLEFHCSQCVLEKAMKVSLVHLKWTTKYCCAMQTSERNVWIPILLMYEFLVRTLCGRYKGFPTIYCTGSAVANWYLIIRII